MLLFYDFPCLLNIVSAAGHCFRLSAGVPDLLPEIMHFCQKHGVPSLRQSSFTDIKNAAAFFPLRHFQKIVMDSVSSIFSDVTGLLQAPVFFAGLAL